MQDHENNVIIDTKISIELPRDDMEMPPDPPKFPINKENEKIKITENKNSKTFDNIEIKPYIHDISSTFSIMSIYNEATKQIEIYDLNETYKTQTEQTEENTIDNSSNENVELKLLWTYKIESDKLRSMKIIENEEYPLICINTTEGIDILTLKTGEIYQVIKINEGGNNKTKWSPTRPTELVNLSYNHTLFTYDIIKRQYEIISSGVSCFIITTKGEILFINEDEIYICHNKEDILNKKRIFNNNINMLNVYEDKAIIISRKKEDTEGIILSLYEYENNEIRSFLYDRIKSDDIESIINDGNISSSILHSLVFIGLYKEETFLYLNCESVDHFEMMNIGDDKIISIPYDEDYDTEKIHGFKFIDKNINENLRFPSTIHFFGKNIINIYNIDSLSMEVEEPWYFPVQEPTEPPILFDELKLPTKKQINTSSTKPSKSTKSTKLKKSKTKKSRIQSVESPEEEEIETSEEAIISIDVSEEIKMEKTETESPVDPPKFPINKENEKIKITENKNNKTINNNEIKPYIHDISSTFSIMNRRNISSNQN
ncbi:hypothetical protein M9Y10_021991 [Tritrichomonas musculus]|uniref:Minichromosome loss protein Mcl1 middle region domain-containing protein n=1 Tax=Tritrichomonas musculus TaxID=1915356 RepID=A0ABR2KRW6_9EUKA